MKWTRATFEIDTDPLRLDHDLIHKYLKEESYWSAGLPRETMSTSIANSLCFGVYDQSQQVGFARIISDKATFAYLADVFILTSHRGRGLSVWLMECIVAMPELANLRRWMLATRDAHSLYAKFGFTPLVRPESIMERLDMEIYTRNNPPANADANPS